MIVCSKMRKNSFNTADGGRRDGSGYHEDDSNDSKSTGKRKNRASKRQETKEKREIASEKSY